MELRRNCAKEGWCATVWYCLVWVLCQVGFNSGRCTKLWSYGSHRLNVFFLNGDSPPNPPVPLLFFFATKVRVWPYFEKEPKFVIFFTTKAHLIFLEESFPYQMCSPQLRIIGNLLVSELVSLLMGSIVPLAFTTALIREAKKERKNLVREAWPKKKNLGRGGQEKEVVGRSGLGWVLCCHCWRSACSFLLIFFTFLDHLIFEAAPVRLNSFLIFFSFFFFMIQFLKQHLCLLVGRWVFNILEGGSTTADVEAAKGLLVILKR